MKPRLILLGLILLAISWGLSHGIRTLSMPELWQALHGEGPLGTALAVREWRLPRLLIAAIAGAALGLSGTIFQSLLRNPLGSPDLLGFNTGAYSGVLLAMILWPHLPAATTLGALAGGLSVALAVYWLSWRSGSQSLRLILVGIGMSALLAAFNQWLTISANLDTAMSAAIWAAGSLNGISWMRALPALILLPLLMLVSRLLYRPMQLIEMGDDSAAALGVHVESCRRTLLLTGVAITAIITAVCGPVAFVALASPHLARSFSRQHGLALPALTGGFLLLLADLIAQHLFFPAQLPAGIITVCAGGFYLLWLLIRPSRD